MSKKRYWMIVAMVLGMCGGAASAAPLSNGHSQTCGNGFIGTWHFVNNQTAGATAGVLNASWDSGNTCSTGPTKVLQKVQHFYCTASGTLTGASTTLPGRLLLSDFTCTDPTQPPPPPGESGT